MNMIEKESEEVTMLREGHAAMTAVMGSEQREQSGSSACLSPQRGVSRDRERHFQMPPASTQGHCPCPSSSSAAHTHQYSAASLWCSRLLEERRKNAHSVGMGSCLHSVHVLRQ